MYKNLTRGLLVLILEDRTDVGHAVANRWLSVHGRYATFDRPGAISRSGWEYR